jgi:hypothetical protein
VLGIMSWGAGLAKPHIDFYISAVKEKGSLYALACWRHWLHKQDLGGITKLHGWSDGGRHFRCNRSISTISVKGLERLIEIAPVARQNNFELEDSFGVPKHFKNECDGEFNHLRRMLKELSAKTTVSDIPQVVNLWRDLDAEYAAKKKNPKRTASFIDWVPTWSRKEMEEYSVQFKPASFTEGIMTSHSFLARLNDKRKTVLRGAGENNNKFTGIDFKAVMVGNGKADALRTCRPVELTEKAEVAADAGAAAAAEAAELEVEFAEIFAEGAGGEGNGQCLLASKEINGWQISYRLTEPEKKPASFFETNQHRMAARFIQAGVPMVTPRSSKPLNEKLDADRKWKSTKQQRIGKWFVPKPK